MSNLAKLAIYKKVIHHNQVEFILEIQGWLNVHKSIIVIHSSKRLKYKNI